MKKTVIALMIITILSKALGFGRDVTLSFFYGTSSISDAYLVATTIPTVIFGFVSVGITAGFIPMYNHVQKAVDAQGADRYTNNLINISLIISTVIVAAGVLFAEQLVRVFAWGFTGDTLAMATSFTRISLLGIYCIGAIAVFTGFLQIKGSYMIPAMIGLPLNLVLITSIVLSSKINIIFLAAGSALAIAAQLLFMYPAVLKKGYRYQAIVDFKDRHIKKMAALMMPIIVSTSVGQINVLVDRTLASGIAVGGISALNYASRLNEFALGLFAIPIVTVMYPKISKMAAVGERAELRRTVKEAIVLICLLVLPVAVGTMIFAEPVVRLLFGRGAFDANGVAMTAGVLVFYAIGLIGFALRDVLSRGFYAVQDTKTPMFNAAIAVGLNIILNIILSRYLGLPGLALATSISALFCTALLFVSFRSKIGFWGLKSLVITGLKIFLLSLVMGFVAKYAYAFLLGYTAQGASLLLAILFGAVMYFSMAYLAGIQEVVQMIATLKNKLRRS